MYALHIKRFHVLNHAKTEPLEMVVHTKSIFMPCCNVTSARQRRQEVWNVYGNLQSTHPPAKASLTFFVFLHEKQNLHLSRQKQHPEAIVCACDEDDEEHLVEPSTPRVYLIK